MKPIYVIAILSLCLQAQAQIKYPQAKIEGHVLDESGATIANTRVEGGFTVLKTTNPFDWQADVRFVATTDSNGVFTVIGSTLHSCGFGVNKTGYYHGFAGPDLVKHDADKWLPWPQVVKLKLRKIGTPIPMYARTFYSLILPATNAPVGYDLAVGDWIAPYGKGLVGDLVFTLHREFHERFVFKWDLTVQFPGEGNGWRAISPAEENHQSELRYPRTAPAEGYDHNQMYLAVDSTMNAEWQTNSTAATNYFFRVRTEYDANKQLKSAMYGKLLGPVQVNVQSTPTAKLKLTYYLNPTSLDRNMEFDPKKNLFKNLPFLEQVSKP